MKDVTKELFSYFHFIGSGGFPPPRDLDKIKSLIEKGAELDKINPGFNLDMLSAVIGNTKSKKERLATVKLLIDSGAKINFEDKFSSPLRLALQALDFKVVKLLLESGAVIVPPRDLYASKIIWKDNMKFFSLLLEYGLDINSTVSYPSRGGADDEFEIPGDSILMYAAFSEAINIMKCLIEKNVDIHYSQPFSGTALAQSVKDNRIASIELLLEAGSDPDEIVSPSEMPILRIAISRGYFDAVKLLLKYGATIKGAYFREDLDNLNIPRDVAQKLEELLS